MKKFPVPTAAMLALSLCSTGLAQWSQTNGPHGVEMRSFAFTGKSLLAGTHSGVYRSTDDGASWIPSGLANEIVNAIGLSRIMDTTTIFAATGIPEISPGGLFRSTDDGTSWDFSNPGGAGLFYSFMAASASAGTSLFVGTLSGRVFHSTNNGLTWNRADSGLTPGGGVTSFAQWGNDLFAAAEDGTVFRSTNSGNDWSAFGSGLPPRGDYRVALAVLPMTGGEENPTFFAAYDFFGIYLSTDFGKTWIPANNGLPAGGYFHFAVSGGNIFASVNSGLPEDVYMSTNNGSGWNSVSIGLPAGVTVSSLFINGSYLFAGTDTAGIWRRPLSELITSFQQDKHVEGPSQFMLAQNYPNPFNPSTKIQYRVPISGFVSLKVFDVLGREVRTLVNDMKHPGSYEATFDARGLASSVYVYRLQSGSFVETRKLMLLR